MLVCVSCYMRSLTPIPVHSIICIEILFCVSGGKKETVRKNPTQDFSAARIDTPGTVEALTVLFYHITCHGFLF